MQFFRRRVAAAAILLVTLSLMLLVGFRWGRAGSLPRVAVDGVDVGGLEEGELNRRLTRLAQRREAEEIEVVRRAIAAADAESRTFTRSEVGYSFDVRATREKVLERGRQANPLAALADHIRASFTTIDVAPEDRVRSEDVDGWAERVAEAFETAPRDGDLRFNRGAVRPVMPRPGMVVELEPLLRMARVVAMRSGAQELEVPFREVEPEMSTAAVRDAAADAREVLAGPVTVARGGTKVRLMPKELGRVLTTSTRATSGAKALELSVDPKRLREVAGARLEALERPAQDADLTLSGGSVKVVPGEAGFELNHEKLAQRLLAIARTEDRRGRAPGDRKPPDFSTADARALKIGEQVSTFTTEHACCEPRVQNIHRIADVIDGTIVEPGETFSVNEAVGERTRQKGFVAAPAIFEGEYVEEIGGGISQFATTMFNAIFFGGYQLVDYKAHSYYISRYPAGREATLAWPSVDLEFRNDSDGGVYIDTSYTDTSITVTFYGSSEVEVTSRSGDPYNLKKPPTRCKENRSLSKGEHRVTQEGKRGFDIVVYRVFQGSGERERFFTRYLPEPRIVERRSCG